MKTQEKYKENTRKIYSWLCLCTMYIYRYDKIDNLHYENKFTITFRPTLTKF